jgi:hypothetical protein
VADWSQSVIPRPIMVMVRRFRWLVVVAVTLVVFGVGLAALFSTGDGTGQPTAEGCAATTSPLRSIVPTNPTPSLKAPLLSGSTAVVPNVVGMAGRASRSDQPAAASAITAAGLKAKLYTEHFGGYGAWWSVVSQSPASGSIVPIGSAVVLTMRYGCPVTPQG